MTENPFAALAPPPEQPKAADLISEYIKLRDGKKAAEDAIKQWTKDNFTARMDEIEVQLLATLNAIGADNVKADTGTAFKKTETSITVADATAFQRHVIGTEAWQLIDFRANKTGVKEYLEEHETLPPGVNYSSTTIIAVRKPS